MNIPYDSLNKLPCIFSLNISSDMHPLTLVGNPKFPLIEISLSCSSVEPKLCSWNFVLISRPIVSMFIHIYISFFSFSLHLSFFPSFLQKRAKRWPLNESNFPLHEAQVLKTYLHNPPASPLKSKLLDLFCVSNHKLLLILSSKSKLPVVPTLHTCHSLGKYSFQSEQHIM